jgi:deoxycytidylate deaminase
MDSSFESKLNKKNIKYPYLPEGKEIKYVSKENPFMQMAKKFAFENSLDRVMPTSSVIVMGENVLGTGANGSDYHENNVCERVRQNIPTGQGYELCEGCHPKNHSESKAVSDAKSKGHDVVGADLYLWGHWWCCEPCWKSMIDAGIKNVFLLENSEVLFNKESPDNIVGNQFK